MRSLVVFLVGCASLHYDKPPTPVWIHQAGSRLDGGVVDMVGIAPATEDFRGDAERAFASANQRLAETLVSQVRTQSSDWTWSSGSKEQQVVEQAVDVRTDIKLEGVTQTGAYRDEVTASQYVLARVDFAAFARKLSARLQPTLETLARGLAEAKTNELPRTVEAYVSLLKLRNVANAALDDAKVLGVIAPRDAALVSLRGAMRGIDELTKRIASKGTFTITATGPDAEVNERMKAAAREVFARWGFSDAGGKDPSVRLTIAVDTKRQADEARGGRNEFVYGAIGSARVEQRAGAWNALSATLPEGRYTETHASEPEAKRRALQSGADTLMSLWRGLSRSLTEG